MSEHIIRSASAGRLSVNWMRGGGHDFEVRFFWRREYRFALRFGRKGWRVFSERNQIDTGRSYRYLLGKWITIIGPR
jgi:hypothetical protein